MLRTICLVPLVCLAGSAAAQAPIRPDPAEPRAGAPERPYESAFKDYRPYVDPDLARWRVVNDEMGRLNGHLGHLPQQPGTEVKPGGKPSAQDGHGAHK